MTETTENLSNRVADGSSGGGAVTPPHESASGAAFVGPTCVGRCVDSLYLSFYVRIPAAYLRILEEARATSQAIEEGRLSIGATGEPEVELGRLFNTPLKFRIKSHGVRGYRYLAHNDLWHVAIGKKSSVDQSPSMIVQVLSATLWEKRPGDGDNSPWEAYKLVRSWVDSIHQGEEKARAVVTRIDLAADMVGINPESSDRAAFVTRARKVAMFEDGESLERAKCDRFWEGRAFSGFRFGKSAVVFRIYDKVREIAHSGKAWFFEVWAGARDASGAPAWNGEAVWRCEAQFRRDALREIRLAELTSGKVLTSPDVDVTPEEILRDLGALWRYAVGAPGKSGGWIQWKIPDSAEAQPCRWKVRPEWEALRAVAWPCAGHSIVREARKRATEDVLLPGFLGYLSSLAALLKERDPRKAMDRVGLRTLEHLAERAERAGCLPGVFFARRVDAKTIELEAEIARMAKGEEGDP